MAKPWYHHADQEVLVKEEEFVIVNRAGALLALTNNSYIANTFEYTFRKLATDNTYNGMLDRYTNVWTVPLSVISRHSSTIYRRANDSDDDETRDLLRRVESVLISYDPDAKTKAAAGMVRFSMLPNLFEKGKDIYSGTGRDLIAGRVHATNMKQTWAGTPYVEIQISVLTALGGTLVPALANFYIDEFNGWIQPSELDVKTLPDDMRETLQQRGAAVKLVTDSASYVRCRGNVVQRSWWGSQVYRAEGRAMIDADTFKRMEEEKFDSLRRRAGVQFQEREHYGRQTVTGDTKAEEQMINTDLLFTALPYVYGFSLAAKQWGQFHINDISPVEYRKDAFTKLVLPDETKTLIKALITHNGSGFQDLIESKGGGTIFLLHGRPGGGKTLTAEAIAELLERPLYSVSVGELGTDPAELERSLRSILDVATVWNAIILLDEADIFLEARDEHDLLRNAMVGVFLRLLEYHQGVLFLTTNRVKNFDAAFHSRISIAIKYPDMDVDIRAKIWTNLLDAAGIKGLDVPWLAKFDINGRQIKTAIRLAQALAASENTTLNEVHVGRVVALADKFERDVAGEQGIE